MGSSPSTNDLAVTLDEGDVALGLLDDTYSPTLVEFFGELGLDFVRFDLEHGGPDPWDAGTHDRRAREDRHRLARRLRGRSTGGRVTAPATRRPVR